VAFRRSGVFARFEFGQPCIGFFGGGVEAGRLDVDRLHAFLVPKSRDAAQRAVKAIRQGVKALARHPQSGRPVEELPPEFREGLIEFGQGAYVALCHYDGRQVVMLAVRHGREAGS
jgi:plasmid stabilization system protein ParE